MGNMIVGNMSFKLSKEKGLLKGLKQFNMAGLPTIILEKMNNENPIVMAIASDPF